jgi:hypothetical protein
MSALDLTIQWVVLVAACIFMIMRGQFTIFHPSSIYLVFHMIVFCIRPTLVQYRDFDLVWNYMKLTPTDELLRFTLWVTSASLLLFIICFSFATNARGARDMPKRMSITPEIRKAYIYMVILFAPLGAYSILGANQTHERVGDVVIMTGTTGYTNEAQNVFIPITILFIVLFKWKWWSFLPFLCFVYFRLTQGWARWTVILPFLAVVTFYCWNNRRNLPPIQWLIPVPFLLLLFNTLSFNRMYIKNLFQESEYGETIVKEIDSIEDKQFGFNKQWDTTDFANYDFLAYILDKVPKETHAYTYGVQHLQLFTEPIPRKLWKNKPVGAPIKFFNLSDYGDFNGLTVSIIGDGWMTAGWIGVIINMGLAGFGLGYFYTWFIRNNNNIFKVTIFIICNSILLQLFRDGGIVSMAKFMLFTQSPIFVWWFIYNRMVRSSDQDEDAFESEEEMIRYT